MARIGGTSTSISTIAIRMVGEVPGSRSTVVSPIKRGCSSESNAVTTKCRAGPAGISRSTTVSSSELTATESERSSIPGPVTSIRTEVIPLGAGAEAVFAAPVLDEERLKERRTDAVPFSSPPWQPVKKRESTATNSQLILALSRVLFMMKSSPYGLVSFREVLTLSGFSSSSAQRAGLKAMYSRMRFKSFSFRMMCSW
ncbi:MAG: hypothetical protein MCM46_04775 [Candidatus Manganitrophus sp. SB1]|nr:hypothetical protein [Candidatus Manganitrophus morganii]